MERVPIAGGSQTADYLVEVIRSDDVEADLSIVRLKIGHCLAVEIDDALTERFCNLFCRTEIDLDLHQSGRWRFIFDHLIRIFKRQAVL